MNSTIISETEYLFNRDYFDNSITEDVEEEYTDRADALLSSYSWDDIFDCWFDYLKNNCKTEKEVINWANLFFCYGGADNPIDDPYKFLGYLYYKVDVLNNVDEAQHIFDSIAISILEPMGYIDLIKDPCYAPESDPNIIKSVQNWKQQK